MEEYRDEFLREIASHFGCGKDAVARALKKLGFTRKKTKNLQRKEGIAKIFINKIKELPKDQRIFLDESGVDKFCIKIMQELKRKKVKAEVAGKKFERQ